MQNQTNERIKDGLTLGGLFIALLLFTLFIPGIEIISLVILPIPIAVYSYRHNWKAALILSAVIFFSISILAFYFFIMSLPLALIAILAGILIGEALKSGRHPYEVWGRGAIGFALGYLVLLFVLDLITNQSLMVEYQLIIKESMDSTHSLFTQAGMELSEENIKLIEDQMIALLDLIPAILVIISMIYSFIAQWLTHKVLNKWDQTKFVFPQFRSFRLPRLILWLYLLTIIISWFSFDVASAFGMTIYNISLVIGFLFSIQGLSVIIFYLMKKRKSKALSIILIAIIIIFLPIGMYLTRILGIIDAGFHLRKTIK